MFASFAGLLFALFSALSLPISVACAVECFVGDRTPSTSGHTHQHHRGGSDGCPDSSTPADSYGGHECAHAPVVTERIEKANVRRAADSGKILPNLSAECLQRIQFHFPSALVVVERLNGPGNLDDRITVLRI